MLHDDLLSKEHFAVHKKAGVAMRTVALFFFENKLIDRIFKTHSNHFMQNKNRIKISRLFNKTDLSTLRTELY